MFNVLNFNWQLESGRKVYEILYSDEAAFDTSGSDILQKLTTRAQLLTFNYFEAVFYNSQFERAGNSVPVSVILIELPFTIPIKAKPTHPLQDLFNKGHKLSDIGTIEESKWSSCAEAYEFYSKIQPPIVPLWHIQHYPLRGNGVSMTLKKLRGLHVTKKDLVADEPFNLLNYKIFNKVFYNNATDDTPIVGTAQDSVEHPTAIKTQGYLANGTLRIIN
mgnify:CR=1 FL=1